jgi:hypothetical protein
MKVFIAETSCVQSGAEVPATLARDLRRADSFISLAVQAGFAAVGGETSTHPRSGRHGLVLGTAFGPMQTNFEVLDQVVRQDQTSPTLFSHSVFNAAAGYLSRIFGLQGSAITVTDFAFPFFQALQQGSIAVASGRLDSCLILQVETYSDILADARIRIFGSGAAPWQAGAVAWLLTGEGGTHEIAAIDVHLQPSDGRMYISVAEQLTAGNRSIRLTDPLASALAATRLLAESARKELSFQLSAPYGHIRLNCKPSTPEREKHGTRK